MKITIDGKDFEIPFDLSVIKLGEFIDYQARYGNKMDQKFTDLQTKKYSDDEEVAEVQKFIDMEDYLDEEAVAWFSFWTGLNPKEVKAQEGIIPFLLQYRQLRLIIKQETERERNEFPMRFEWQGEQWLIEDFKINPASAMSFSEVITSKETLRQLHALGKGHWEALPYLAVLRGGR